MQSLEKLIRKINKKVSKLSAVEILSAKPAWNIPIKTPSKEIEQHKAMI
jgi:hypothetical protein|tara:strand:- start:1239 stop:1385 length:147 start_codon:yes stop_codon:yes gene_type:complete